MTYLKYWPQSEYYKINNNFSHTIKHLGTDDDIVFARGSIPIHSYMTSRNKFAETVFPPIEAFYDTLKTNH